MKDFELEGSEDFKNLRIQDFKNKDFEEFDGLKTLRPIHKKKQTRLKEVIVSLHSTIKRL